MSDFYFSTEAMNALHVFYLSDAVVYVEGDDDVLFWEGFFKEADFSVKIEEVGGKENLEPYITKIIDDNAKIIVATDSDYSMIIGNKIEHPLIIYTSGYAIENTLYCPNSLNLVIISYAKKQSDFSEEIKVWMKSFTEKVKELVAYDLANEIYGKSKKVLGDACNRFLTNNNSTELDENKVSMFIENELSDFKPEEIIYAKQLLEELPQPLFLQIKGHFLTSAVINLIRQEVKRVSDKKLTLSSDSLYSNTVNNCIGNGCSCEYKENYINDIKNAKKELNSTV